ncbi:MAG: ATP-dependent zinc protease [Puniceicoccaceae bacterium]
MPPRSKHKLVGWKEIVHFPEWGIYGVTAKMDTGARRSAIDVRKIEELSKGRIRFQLALEKEKKLPFITAAIRHQTHVRSSNGHTQERYFIETVLQIGEIEKTVQFSLVNRTSMSCRVLIGRRALAPELLVDSQSTFLLGKNSPSLRS